MSVFPNGTGWSCSGCGRKHPEDYEPLTCGCGGVLSRVLASFELGGMARRRGLVCEEHPELPWPHGDCAGPGMLREDVERT